MFERLIEGTSKENLVEDLIAEYGIDRDLAVEDVEAFILKVESEDLFE